MSYPTYNAPPQGWVRHTDPNAAAQGYYYNPSNPAQMCIVVAVAAPVAAPQPAAAPQQSWQDAWQDADSSKLDESAKKHVFQSRGEHIYIDLPEVKTVGDTSDVYVRLLPAPKGDYPQPFVASARHRLYAEFDPKAREGKGDRKFFYPDCFNVVGAPGECPIDRVLFDLKDTNNDEAMKFADNANARARYMFQGIDLRDPAKHFRQVTEQGVPVLDAAGQPVWEIVPGIITAGRELFKAIVEQNSFFVKKSQGGASVFHPIYGTNLFLSKKKTGPADMNVDYGCVLDPTGPSQMDGRMIQVTANLYDLRKLIRYRSREEMDAIAANIRSRFVGALKGQVSVSVPAGMPGAPPMSQWQTHPNNPAYEWDPVTGQTRVKQQAAPPVPPPVPAPVAPPVPMAAPPPPVPAAAPFAAPPPPAPYQPPAPAAAPYGAPPPVAAPPPPIAAPPPLAAPQAPPPPPVAGTVVAMPPPIAGMQLPPPVAPGGYSAAPVAPPPMPGMPTAALPSLPPPPGGAVPSALGAPPPPPPGAPGALSPAQVEAMVAGQPVPSFP